MDKRCEDLTSPETAQAGVGAEDVNAIAGAVTLAEALDALAKQQEKVKYAITFEICSDPLVGAFIANTKLPYLVPAGMEKHAYNVLSRRHNKVFIADKETLLANECDLREEDFADPIQLPESKPDNE